MDLETFTPRPDVAGKSSHGGYCGPAVKPIALHLVASVASAIAPYKELNSGSAKKNPHGMEVHVPRIIEEECVGCNLWALVCPVENCITMKHIDTGKAPMSWKQRTKSDPTCAPSLPSGE